MEESSQSDKEFEWDHLNIEKKHELCVQLLKKTKREKSVLFVKNKNLKNTIKNMEIELCKIKDALRVEECKFLQLYEKLNTKTRERLESKAREERLSESVDILHSRLQREISRRELLEEKIKMVRGHLCKGFQVLSMELIEGGKEGFRGWGRELREGEAPPRIFYTTAQPLNSLFVYRVAWNMASLSYKSSENSGFHSIESRCKF